MEPKEAASLAGRLVTVLEDPKETDADRLSTLGEALAGLAAKMEPKEAAAVAGRGAQHLAGCWRTRRKPMLTAYISLGQALGTLSLKIPTARQTQLLALSHMLSHQVRSQDVERRTNGTREMVIRLCDPLGPQDLAEVLKWPFAAGEAETIVLASLEKKTGKQFAGDVWKFVEQAESLGIKDIELPAKRPRAEDALRELDKLRGGTAHR